MPRTITMVVNEEFCKGCGLCVFFCPKNALKLRKEMDDRGFHIAHLAHPEECGGCAQCAAMCPDGCFRITSDQAAVPQ